MYLFALLPYLVFLKSFIIETPSMSLGIFTPAMSKNVGAKSMFKTISFILDENKISNKVRLSFHNKRKVETCTSLPPLEITKWYVALFLGRKLYAGKTLLSKQILLFQLFVITGSVVACGNFKYIPKIGKYNVVNSWTYIRDNAQETIVFKINLPK